MILNYNLMSYISNVINRFVRSFIIVDGYLYL